MSDPRLDEILRFLNAKKLRATYGAVAGVLGVLPRSMGARLGHRRPAASWVVNAETGLPTGYGAAEMHSALTASPTIMKSADELLRRMAQWTRENGSAAVSDVSESIEGEGTTNESLRSFGAIMLDGAVALTGVAVLVVALAEGNILVAVLERWQTSF